MKTKIINIMLNHLTDEQKERIADEILRIDKRGLDEILGEGDHLGEIINFNDVKNAIQQRYK